MHRILTGIAGLTLLAASTLLSAATAVDMPLTDINGNKLNLKSFSGKWVVVNYWATWCPPCISEMPELQAFHDKHENEGAVVVGINIEFIGARQLKTFLDDYFITYPVFVSEPIQQSELGLIPGLPTTFLVTPTGEVVARQVGPVTGDMIEKFIDKWEAK